MAFPSLASYYLDDKSLLMYVMAQYYFYIFLELI